MENKKKNPVDDLFRRKLNEEQLVPDDSLWNEIENKLDKKKPRRRIIIWLVLSVLLLGGVSSILHFKNENVVVGDNTNKSVNVVGENTNNGGERVVGQETNNGNGINKGGATNNNNSANSSSTQTENSNSSSSKNISATQTQVNTSGNKTGGFKSIGKVGGETNNKGATENKKVVSGNSSSGAKKIVGENTNNGAGDKSNNTQNQTETATNSIGAIVADNNNGAENIYGEKINEKENEVINQLDNTQQQNTNVNANNSSAQNQALLDSLAVVNQKNKIEPLPLTVTKEKKWFVEVGCSFINNKNQVPLSGNFVDTLYQTQRWNNEKSASTFNYNFNVGINVKRLQFKSGIDIMRFGENIEYENRGHCWMLKSLGYYTVDSTFVVTGYDTISAHTQQNDLVAARNGKTVNTYLSIPLMISYSLPIKTLKLQVGLGGYAGFPLSWNSFYINREVTDLINFSDEGLLRKMILGYQFNAGVSVPLSKHFDAMLAYEYRRNLTQVEKRSYISSKRFYGSGANLSVRYNF